jgi:hypothetical protein
MSDFNPADYQFDDETEDSVRAPDPVKRECLIGYPRPRQPEPQHHNYTFASEDELNKILKESEEEYLNKIVSAIAEEERRKVEEEKQKTSGVIQSIKVKLQKMFTLDKKNADVYETLLSIIEMRELDCIISYKVDEESYNIYHKVLKTIRLTSDEAVFIENLLDKE